MRCSIHTAGCVGLRVQTCRTRSVLIDGSDSQFFPLQLERGANDKEVKKAYRQLSLQYHPDKNPDPAAAEIFTRLSKAHKALTGWINAVKLQIAHTDLGL